MRAAYNFTSQVLRIGINESLAEDSLIGLSLCNYGTLEKYLNQTCSVIEVNLSPQAVSDLILIAFPPACNACVPVLDYTVYMGIDFTLNGEKFFGLTIMLAISSMNVCILNNGNLCLLRKSH